MYCVPATSPPSRYVADMLPVLDTIVDQVEPPLVDLSISYPVIYKPPLLDGMVQLKFICDEEIGVAVNPVGEPEIPGSTPESKSATRFPKYDGSLSNGFGKLSSVMYTYPTYFDALLRKI